MLVIGMTSKKREEAGTKQDPASPRELPVRDTPRGPDTPTWDDCHQLGTIVTVFVYIINAIQVRRLMVVLLYYHLRKLSVVHSNMS
jgi:hypothetical protein